MVAFGDEGGGGSHETPSGELCKQMASVFLVKLRPRSRPRSSLSGDPAPSTGQDAWKVLAKYY